jgi:predicted Rossmann fold flavoprotein
MPSRRFIIVGGGAAGFFAAVTCAEAAGSNGQVVLLEKTSHFLSKVRISGGGRCNVTHSCFDARELTKRYPRGEKALISPFLRFQASDTVAWFAERGVELKTEEDGRMFPVTDSSQTIIDCLTREAKEAKVQLLANRGVDKVQRRETGFVLTLSNGEEMTCERLLLATGGCRSESAGALAVSLGHTIAPPVPSLFTFHIECPWLKEIPGVSVEQAEVGVSGTALKERGPVLVTHWGLSGPAILRLSAWGARELHQLNYRFPLVVNWLPGLHPDQLQTQLQAHRSNNQAKYMVNVPFGHIPSRLWHKLVLASGFRPDARWSSLSKAGLNALMQQLTRTEFAVTGKSLNKDEFVTCGGVSLKEVNFKTMESRVCPGLFFAGELLDIDGITGGFNFQAAWTTGWIAGHAMVMDSDPVTGFVTAAKVK